MRKGNFNFLIVLAVLSGFLFRTSRDFAKELTITNTNTESPTPSPVTSFTMLQKIQDGISLLKRTPPLSYEMKYITTKKGVKIKTTDLSRKQIALAILNKNTGEVFEKRVWVNEQDITNYKKTGLLQFVPTSVNEVLDIQHRWWNSFNSFYEVTGHPELVVVANKYLFPSKYLSGLPEKSDKQYTDIIYAPYSTQLHSAELVEAGKSYLQRNIDQAFLELIAANVRSHLSGGTLITDGIDKDFIRNILLVEHVDPDSFVSSDDNGRELSERVLTIIGSNQNMAYRYTGSPAGASGLSQFIQPTYKNIVARYPEAHLIKDYPVGMADHVNAIKAMVLFFDSHKKDIADRIKRRDIAKSLGITEEMLAATYNGGPSRVITSVNKLGMAWFTDQINLPRAGQILRKETLNYVKKFEAIKSLHLFANISGS